MTQHPTDPGLIAQGGSEAAGTDILAQAKAVLERRWTNPGPEYHEIVPTGVVELGDWASEYLPELLAEVERLRGALDALATELQAHVHTTPSDDDHEIICDVESAIAHRIRDVLRGDQ